MKPKTAVDAALHTHDIGSLRKDVDSILCGQRLMGEAIVKLTTTMSFLGMLEARVLTMEGKLNKILGGLVLVSVTVPVACAAIATVAVYILGR